MLKQKNVNAGICFILVLVVFSQIITQSGLGFEYVNTQVEEETAAILPTSDVQYGVIAPLDSSLNVGVTLLDTMMQTGQSNQDRQRQDIASSQEFAEIMQSTCDTLILFAHGRSEGLVGPEGIIPWNDVRKFSQLRRDKNLTTIIAACHGESIIDIVPQISFEKYNLLSEADLTVESGFFNVFKGIIDAQCAALIIGRFLLNVCKSADLQYVQAIQPLIENYTNRLVQFPLSSYTVEFGISWSGYIDASTRIEDSFWIRRQLSEVKRSGSSVFYSFEGWVGTAKGSSERVLVQVEYNYLTDTSTTTYGWWEKVGTPGWRFYRTFSGRSWNFQTSFRDTWAPSWWYTASISLHGPSTPSLSFQNVGDWTTIGTISLTTSGVYSGLEVFRNGQCVIDEGGGVGEIFTIPLALGWNSITATLFTVQGTTIYSEIQILYDVEIPEIENFRVKPLGASVWTLLNTGGLYEFSDEGVEIEVMAHDDVGISTIQVMDNNQWVNLPDGKYTRTFIPGTDEEVLLLFRVVDFTGRCTEGELNLHHDSLGPEFLSFLVREFENGICVNETIYIPSEEMQVLPWSRADQITICPVLAEDAILYYWTEDFYAFQELSGRELSVLLPANFTGFIDVGFQATDLLRNPSVLSFFRLSVDRSPPVVDVDTSIFEGNQLISWDGRTLESPIWVNVFTTDNGVGVAKIESRFTQFGNSAPNWENWTGLTSFMGNFTGIYFLEIRVWDKLDQMSSLLTVFVFDFAWCDHPLVSTDSLYYAPSDSIPVTLRYFGSECFTHYEIFLCSYQRVLESWNITGSLLVIPAPITEGTFQLIARGWSEYGNPSGNGTAVIFVDNTPPNLEFGNLPSTRETSTNQRLFAIPVHVDDVAGVSDILISDFNGNIYYFSGSEIDNEGWAHLQVVLFAGNNDFLIRLTDAVGNSMTKSFSLYCDFTKPWNGGARSGIIFDGVKYFNESFVILDVSDAQSGMAYVVIEEGECHYSAEMFAGVWKFAVPVDFFDGRVRDVRIIACDHANNLRILHESWSFDSNFPQIRFDIEREISEGEDYFSCSVEAVDNIALASVDIIVNDVSVYSSPLNDVIFNLLLSLGEADLNSGKIIFQIGVRDIHGNFQQVGREIINPTGEVDAVAQFTYQAPSGLLDLESIGALADLNSILTTLAENTLLSDILDGAGILGAVDILGDTPTDASQAEKVLGMLRALTFLFSCEVCVATGYFLLKYSAPVPQSRSYFENIAPSLSILGNLVLMAIEPLPRDSIDITEIQIRIGVGAHSYLQLIAKTEIGIESVYSVAPYIGNGYLIDSNGEIRFNGFVKGSYHIYLVNSTPQYYTTIAIDNPGYYTLSILGAPFDGQILVVPESKVGIEITPETTRRDRHVIRWAYMDEERVSVSGEVYSTFRIPDREYPDNIDQIVQDLEYYLRASAPGVETLYRRSGRFRARQYENWRALLVLYVFGKKEVRVRDSSELEAINRGFGVHLSIYGLESLRDAAETRTGIPLGLVTAKNTPEGMIFELSIKVMDAIRRSGILRGIPSKISGSEIQFSFQVTLSESEKSFSGSVRFGRYTIYPQFGGLEDKAGLCISFGYSDTKGLSFGISRETITPFLVSALPLEFHRTVELRVDANEFTFNTTSTLRQNSGGRIRTLIGFTAEQSMGWDFEVARSAAILLRTPDLWEIVRTTVESKLKDMPPPINAFTSVVLNTFKNSMCLEGVFELSVNGTNNNDGGMDSVKNPTIFLVAALSGYFGTELMPSALFGAPHVVVGKMLGLAALLLGSSVIAALNASLGVLLGIEISLPILDDFGLDPDIQLWLDVDFDIPMATLNDPLELVTLLTKTLLIRLPEELVKIAWMIAKKLAYGTLQHIATWVLNGIVSAGHYVIAGVRTAAEIFYAGLQVVKDATQIARAIPIEMVRALPLSELSRIYGITEILKVTTNIAVLKTLYSLGTLKQHFQLSTLKRYFSVDQLTRVYGAKELISAGYALTQIKNYYSPVQLQRAGITVISGIQGGMAASLRLGTSAVSNTISKGTNSVKKVTRSIQSLF